MHNGITLSGCHWEVLCFRFHCCIYRITFYSVYSCVFIVWENFSNDPRGKQDHLTLKGTYCRKILHNILNFYRKNSYKIRYSVVVVVFFLYLFNSNFTFRIKRSLKFQKIRLVLFLSINFEKATISTE